MRIFFVEQLLCGLLFLLRNHLFLVGSDFIELDSDLIFEFGQFGLALPVLLHWLSY